MTKVMSVEAAGNIMKCTVFGEGKKKMVIIPGLSVRDVCESAELIAGAYSDFHGDYTAYLFDRCADIPSGYTMNDMSEAVAAGMKALGVADAYVFGASQGGMIALYLAERYPELVRCVAVGSSSALIRDDFAAVCAEWKRYAAAGDSAGLTRYFYEILYSKATLEQRGDALFANVPEYSDAELERFIGLVDAFESLDVKERLKDIVCPALVLAAQGDRVFGFYASEELARELGCPLSAYPPEYGHAVYDEAPDFTQRLKDFFDKN